MPLRSPIFAISCSLLAVPVWADGHLSVAPSENAVQSSSQFELGGSVERTSPALAPLETTAQQRVPLTLPLRSTESSRTQANVLGLTLFSDEGWDDGRDAHLLGTAFTAGATTAGVSVTYLDETAEVSRSELFVDYALTQNFSVGLAGVLDRDFTAEDDTTPQLGLNAAYATEGGAFFEGGVSETHSSDPLFGVSIGLRF